MTPQDLTNAIVEGINAGAEQFLEGTLAAVLPVIWLAILGLHLGQEEELYATITDPRRAELIPVG